MKSLEKLYHDAPQHPSPETLDRQIMQHATQHAERRRPLPRKLPGWAPLAAGLGVASLCLLLIRPMFNRHPEPYAPANDQTRTAPGTEATAASDSTEQSGLANAEALIDTEKKRNAVEPPVTRPPDSRSLADRDTAAGSASEARTITAPVATSNSRATSATDPSASQSAQLETQIAELNATPQIELTPPVERLEQIAAEAVSAEKTVSAAPDSSAQPGASRDDTTPSEASPPAAATAAASTQATITQAPSTQAPSTQAGTSQTNPIANTSVSRLTNPLAEPAEFASDNLFDNRAASSSKLPGSTSTDSTSTDSAPPGATPLPAIRWLETLPATSFTIQLAVARNLDTLKSDVSSAGIVATDVHFLPVQLRDDIGYAVLFGEFARLSDAYNAARRIKRFNPWVRKVGDILDEIANPGQ